jgi:flagella basal body P-ring formation protein FlgA
MRPLALIPIFVCLARAACVAVPSNHIVAQDLSTAIPLFQALDPGTMIGFAPLPGTVRVLSSSDVVLIGRRYGLAFPPGELAPSVCVERIVRHLSLDEMREALVSALDINDVRLEVLEFSNQPLPPGQLSFQRSLLNKPPGNSPQMPVIWRGELIYDDRRSLMVWAKVRISVDRDVYLAAKTIPKGAVIRADQIATARIRQFPSLDLAPSTPLVVAGKVARRTLMAGQRIVAEELDTVKDVLQGATVHVRAIDGAASIRFDAIAQASGQKGEVIMIHNPSSGRNFRALIEGSGLVIVRGTL